MKKILIFLFLFCLSMNLHAMQWLANRTEKINKRYQDLSPEWQRVLKEQDQKAQWASDISTAVSYTSGALVSYQFYKRSRRMVGPIFA
jgi:hypothetical protein